MPWLTWADHHVLAFWLIFFAVLTFATCIVALVSEWMERREWDSELLAARQRDRARRARR